VIETGENLFQLHQFKLQFKQPLADANRESLLWGPACPDISLKTGWLNKN